MESNENIELCKKCGGRCCQRYSGAYAPEDFKTDGELTEEELRNILTREENPVSLDWLDGEYGNNLYFLRPRHETGDIVDPSYGGRCINLTENGCILDFEHRPRACRELEPREGGYCISCGDRAGKLDKEVYAEWWEKYNDVLKKLHDTYDLGTCTCGENFFRNGITRGLGMYLKGGFNK